MFLTEASVGLLDFYRRTKEGGRELPVEGVDVVMFHDF